MTSIERTAYPRFRTLITAAELHNHFTVRRGEAAWAAEKTDSDAHLLALVLSLKCLAKMARFPRLEEIPAQVVDFVRRDLELPGGTVPAWASGRIERNHKALARERVGVRNDQPLARQIAATAVRGEAARKNNPPDLINVAVEKRASSNSGTASGVSELARVNLPPFSVPSRARLMSQPRGVGGRSISGQSTLVKSREVCRDRGKLGSHDGSGRWRRSGRPDRAAVGCGAVVRRGAAGLCRAGRRRAEGAGGVLLLRR